MSTLIHSDLMLTQRFDLIINKRQGHVLLIKYIFFWPEISSYTITFKINIQATIKAKLSLEKAISSGLTYHFFDLQLTEIYFTLPCLYCSILLRGRWWLCPHSLRAHYNKFNTNGCLYPKLIVCIQ